MGKKNNYGEIQSRREFFKRAAKATLPILGIALLVSNPIASKAMEVSSECGCSGNCTGSCTGGCRICCEGTCKDTCKDTCQYRCKGSAR